MLHSDRITFAVLLARIYLKGLRGESAYDLEFHHFLRGQQEATAAAAAALVSQTQRIDRLNDLQNAALQRLAKLPTFTNIVQNVQSNEVYSLIIHLLQLITDTSTELSRSSDYTITDK